MKLSQPIHVLKRTAKRLAKERSVPLHAALDSIAVGEGFGAWSRLAARYAQRSAASVLLTTLNPGDLVLIGARPRQGKTLFALDLAAEVAKAGGHASVFSLECTEAEIDARFTQLGVAVPALANWLRVDCNDAIAADYIIAQSATAGPGALIVVDYLQLLDQRRDTPPLELQVRALKAFAAQTGAIIAFISQIDRAYAAGGKQLPSLEDVRLPNPLDLKLFTRACFLHDGEVAFATIS